MFEGLNEAARRFPTMYHKHWRKGVFPYTGWAPHTSQYWLQTDSKANFQKNGNRDGYDEKSIVYSFNSWGFRSDEFMRGDGELAVMFIGCSYTMGVGLRWTDLWTTIVTEHLKKTSGKQVWQYNLGQGGHGSDYVAMTVFQTLEMLRPDVLIVMWPPVDRMLWHDQKHRYPLIASFKNPWQPPHIGRSLIDILTDDQMIFNFLRDFSMVSTMTEKTGIPWFWTMCPGQGPMADELVQSGIIDGSRRIAFEYKYYDRARDNAHPGRISSAKVAEEIIGNLRNRPEMAQFFVNDQEVGVPS